VDDSLASYWKKRDFSVTAEPRGKVAGKGASLGFVVQKHAASRLHYDFRLELDGTLKSWAVPKGPSYDPADKRMAVQVEDHPLAYAGFEGIIPAGQYGAGSVIVWDRGVWVPDGDPSASYRAGKLKFELRGEKLAGRWTLVRMHGHEGERQIPWLLIKEKDDKARPASEFNLVEEMPDSVVSGVPLDPAALAKSSGRAGSRTAGRAAGGAPKRVSATKFADGGKPAGDGKAPSAAGASSAGSTSEVVHALDEASKPVSRKRPPSKAVRTQTETGEIGAEAAAIPERAVRAALPLSLAPQLATLVDSPPAGDDWLYEIKFDGYRILARVDRIGKESDVRLFTRAGNDWTAKFKTLAKAVADLKLPSGWLDGEIVIAGPEGRTDFQALQNAIDSRAVDAIQFFIFDLPFYAGYDLRQAALADRRALLRSLMEANASPLLRFSESFEAEPHELLGAACKLQLEGVIGKKADAAYVSARSRSWIKLKCTRRQEFVIGGYTDPKGSRSGFGALLLGVHDEHGQLKYAGNVGTGFDEKTLAAIKARLDKLASSSNPFHALPRSVKGHWVEPKLVGEVSFTEWTGDGHLRHPVFHALRTDKDPRTIVHEVAAHGDEVEKALDSEASEKHSGRLEKPSKAPAKVTKAATNAAAKTAVIPAENTAGKDAGKPARKTSSIKVSNPGRVIDPSTGLTKLDLVEFYERVAEHLLPHLKGRPVSLVRGPAGIDKQLFFQRHPDTLKIPGVRQLEPSLWAGHPGLMEISTTGAIVAAAQFNVIEVHTWNAKSDAIEKPDRIIFDLDPGEGVEWRQMVEAAQLAKALFDELKLKSFLKTSGGKGLHVVVPLAPRDDWDTVYDFSARIVTQLAKTIPQRFVDKSGPKNRVGKIFVDYLRNSKGATTASAFSARARPGMGVSVPVLWDELTALTSSDQWTIANIGDRLAAVNSDPWTGYHRVRQTVGAAAGRLRGG